MNAVETSMSAPNRVRNIVLIGFSGTGKSVVARRLARRLGWRHVDLDSEIVRREGRPIHAIFATSGEAAFRALEQREVERACGRSHQVIATGGGAVINPRSREVLRRDNLVILLDAAPETIHQRLSQSRRGERRPLLEAADPLVRIRALKAEREAIYRLAAHEVVRTDELSPDEVVEHLEALVRRYGRLGAPAGTPLARRFAAGAAEYLSVVGPGVLDQLGRYLDEVRLGRRVHVITDEVVARVHGERLLEVLRRAGRAAALLALPTGEAAKTLDSAARAYDWLIEQRAERGDAIVALGGGVVGDVGGFVAATYLRGVPLVQVPTTLLAMVDSSIGGKVGINHRLGKNLIGAFYQPRLIVADTTFLQTLPCRELTAGWAEVVKMGLILDAALFAQLEANPAGLLGLEPALVAQAIARSVELKALIVAEDERETGQRMLLNYGHTIGHALEAATGYERLLHGEAVAIGMSAAARIAVELGLLARHDAERQDALLQRLGLPLTASGLDPAALWEPLRRDKKARQARLRWVLLERIGHAVVRDDVPEALVEMALRMAVGAEQ